MAEIYNEKSNTLLVGTNNDDTIQNGGWWDNLTHDGGSKVAIHGGGAMMKFSTTAPVPQYTAMSGTMSLTTKVKTSKSTAATATITFLTTSPT